MKPTPSPRLRSERRFVLRVHGSRRRGQALLLAVLLMVFAALLGATMITLVSSNLNQTTRQGGLSAARASSASAITFVNDRLTNSTEGDMWRPWQDNKPPKSGDSDFNTYFTAFERAKGWVNEVDFRPLPINDTNDYNDNGITYQDASATATFDPREQQSEYVASIDRQILQGKSCYVKFPDPRGPSTNASGPQYLVQMSPSVLTAASKPTGRLQIRVIGTSEDEPGAFDVRDVLKPTTVSRGPFSYARFDSNYDYKNKRVIRTKLTKAITGSTLTLDVEDTTGFEKGRTIIVGDPNTIVVGNPTTVQSAVVFDVAVDPITSVKTIILKVPVTGPTPAMGFPAGPGFVVGTIVSAASPLMDGILDADFDAEGDGTTFSTTGHTWEATLDPVRNADASPALAGARKLFFNGGAALDGKSVVSLSNSDSFSVTGLISPIPAASVGNAMLAVPGATPSENLLPSTAPTPSAPNSLQRLVRDNSGPEGGQIQPLTPPSIDGENSRYRELTQFAAVSGGSTEGFGPGVYVNNRFDLEREVIGGSPLTIAKSHDLYGNKYLPYSTTAASNSLEGRHIRAWTSPTEFRPRALDIEFNGNSVIFTRNDRLDTIPNLPATTEAWKQPSGASLAPTTTDPTLPGANTFRMVLDTRTGQRYFGAAGSGPLGFGMPVGTATPFNGLIFTEGNVSVRGFLGSKSITIVSMGSIFINGSIVRDMNNPTGAPPSTVPGANPNPPRIALLAKRDVVLNPTQLATQVAGAQDNDTAGLTVKLAAAATSGASTITVNTADAVAMRVGDIVHVGDDKLWHTVAKVDTPDATGTPLLLETALAGNAASGSTVLRLSDPKLKTQAFTDPVTGAVTNATFYDLAPSNSLAPSSGEVFARDVRLDGVGGAAPNFLAWRHIGERKPGIDLERDAGPGASPNTTAGTFHVKENVTPSTPEAISGLATANEKLFYTTPSDIPASPGGVPPDTVDLLDIDGDGTRGGDVDETLLKLKTRYDNATSPRGIPLGLTINDWKVNITATGTGAGTRAVDIPGRRLSAVGSDMGGTDDTTVQPGQKYSIPLALSGGWFFQPSWNATSGSVVPAPVGPATKPVPSLQTIGVSGLPADDDDLETTRDDFYQKNVPAPTPGANPGPSPTPVQAPLRWRSAPVPAPGSMSAVGPNIATFAHDPDVILSTDNTSLPHYFFSAPRMERDNFSFPKPGPAGTDRFDAVPIYVQATIFAQEGSWFVVTPPLNDVPDLNRNGSTADPEDLAAATRYRRPNYRVIVKGSIVQNFAPTARTDETGAAKEGAMFRWINALSRPTDVEDAGAGAGNGRGKDWQAIEYQADPLPFYNGLYLPPTPDLLYTS